MSGHTRSSGGLPAGKLPFDNLVDPHIHLMDLRGTPRPAQALGKALWWNERALRFIATRFMPAEMVAFFGRKTDLLGDYLPSDFQADSQPSKIGRYVHIQAGWTEKDPLDPVGETTWLEGLANGPDAIVGYADLRLGAAVAPVLEAHQAASARFRGIRHMLSWHPAGDVMNFAETSDLSTTSQFRAGFDQLAEHGLSFDAWCYGEQIPEVAALAVHNPEVPIVLCHAGTPVGYFGPFGSVGTTEKDREAIAWQWRQAISELAGHRNVYCKLSGLLMPALGLGFELDGAAQPSVKQLTDLLSPIVHHCVDSFGPDRCMVASNFPVDRVSAGYTDVFAAMVNATAGYGQAAQEAMFRDTAASFYRLVS